MAKNKPLHYIVDVDGTVADTTQRAQILSNPRIHQSQRWRAFFREDQVAKDTQIPGSEHLDAVLASDTPVIFLTARPDMLQKATEDQLAGFYRNFDKKKHPVITKPQDKRDVATPQWKSDVINSLCCPKTPFIFVDDDKDNLQRVKDVRPDSVVMKPEDAWGYLSGQKVLQEKEGQVQAVPLAERAVEEDEDEDDDGPDAVLIEMLGPVDFDEEHDPYEVIEIDREDDGELETYEGEREEEDLEEDEDL